MDVLNKKVLIIEDDEAMLTALSDTLTNEGFSIVQARDGKAGLTSALTEHPDIIVLDILMPEMDGTILLERLREDEWGQHVPVIVLTNVKPEKNDILDGVIEYRPAYYLVKSDVTLETIVAKIKELLNISH